MSTLGVTALVLATGLRLGPAGGDDLLADSEPTPTNQPLPGEVTAPADPGPGEAAPPQWEESRVPPFMSALDRLDDNRFSRVRLAASGVAVGGLQKALAAAMPEVAVDTDPTPLGDHDLYVGVTKEGGHDPRVIIITENGRAFFRDVVTTEKDPVPEIIAAIVGLVRRIEGGLGQPDKVHEPVPPPGKFPEPPAEVVIEQGALPKSRGPSWTAGFGLAPELILAAWPSFGSTITGGGGTLDFRARAPGGGLIVAGGRLAFARGADLALMRLRLHVLGGYTWRPGKAEVELAFGALFEPWFVRLAGSNVDPVRDENQGKPPLLGGLMRLAAGYLLHGRDVDVRLGGRIEVSESFAPDKGVRVPAIVHVDGTGQRDAFHLGGLEVILGLDLTAMWRLPAPKAK
jgi:hypothetical protein